MTAAEIMQEEIYTLNRLNRLANEAAETYRAERDALRDLVRKVHAAKGRYHTQLAACDLFDAVGLKNERPSK